MHAHVQISLVYLISTFDMIKYTGLSPSLLAGREPVNDAKDCVDA